MSKDNPCRHCTERTPYCHGSCEQYKKWRAELDAEKQARHLYAERYRMTDGARRAVTRKRRADYSGACKKFSS